MPWGGGGGQKEASRVVRAVHLGGIRSQRWTRPWARGGTLQVRLSPSTWKEGSEFGAPSLSPKCCPQSAAGFTLRLGVSEVPKARAPGSETLGTGGPTQQLGGIQGWAGLGLRARAPPPDTGERTRARDCPCSGRIIKLEKFEKGRKQNENKRETPAQPHARPRPGNAGRCRRRLGARGHGGHGGGAPGVPVPLRAGGRQLPAEGRSPLGDPRARRLRDRSRCICGTDLGAPRAAIPRGFPLPDAGTLRAPLHVRILGRRRPRLLRGCRGARGASPLGGCRRLEGPSQLLGVPVEAARYSFLSLRLVLPPPGFLALNSCRLEIWGGWWVSRFPPRIPRSALSCTIVG